jgi:hypothetical protein
MMDLSTISSAILVALSPIIQKGLEKFAEKSAEEGFSERKAIWARVKSLFKTDDLTLLNLLSEASTDVKTQGKLEGKIETLLENNPETAKELQTLLENIDLEKTKEVSIVQKGVGNIVVQQVKDSNIRIKT